MRIKKILPFILLVFLFISCEKEDFEIETNNQRTVFMYLPWSTNLTSYFYNNISDMEEAIQEKGLENEGVLHIWHIMNFLCAKKQKQLHLPRLQYTDYGSMQSPWFGVAYYIPK